MAAAMEEMHAQEVVEGEEAAGFCGPMTVENLQVRVSVGSNSTM